MFGKILHPLRRFRKRINEPAVELQSPLNPVIPVQAGIQSKDVNLVFLDSRLRRGGTGNFTFPCLFYTLQFYWGEWETEEAIRKNCLRKTPNTKESKTQSSRKVNITSFHSDKIRQ